MVDFFAFNQLARLKFNTKDQYFSWRKEWKHQYKVLSSTIRNLKSVVASSSSEEQSAAQSNRDFLRDIAYGYMYYLEKAKKKAGKQMRDRMKRERRTYDLNTGKYSPPDSVSEDIRILNKELIFE